jgi:hypothetical protein
MPVDADLIRKIALVAGDERGHPRIREIAFGKLAAFKISHTHLFVLPMSEDDPEGEDDAPPWSDVADVEGVRGPPPPAPLTAKDRARFMDAQNWRETTNGNVSILIMVNDIEYRVVLFKHKKTPTFGALRIDTDTDQTTFMHGWWLTREEARLGAWQELAAL